MQLERILDKPFARGGAEKESRAGGEASTTDRPSKGARELSLRIAIRGGGEMSASQLQAELEQERLLSQQLARPPRICRPSARHSFVIDT